MPKNEVPLEAIKRYIPPAAAEQILGYVNHYKVHLTITRERKTVLGDYRHATTYKTHRISVNGNLNKYSFLITLIHELAHLVTFIQYRHAVDPHGKQWKSIYAALLKDFLTVEIFPVDILNALKQSMHDLPASSCSDEKLMRVLRNYDVVQDGVVVIEQIPEGAVFDAGNGKLFKKGKKLRKRYQCQEISSGQVYLFNPIYEVRLVS